ncbi:MAG: hypothetical protein HXY40_07095 [Chloroflexi bacterium]|nr:hypothetical protein [Chloroflexota bacterium]
MRRAILQITRTAYELLARPLLFRTLTAQAAHEQALRLCAYFDEHPQPLGRLQRYLLPPQPCMVGGVNLPQPLMLAAGFVKGTGFATEEDAQKAVACGDNIIPGWRSVPALLGAVEFGSYTRWPRLGNPGNVLWRNIGGRRSLQNRVGLKNPGARAAAAFLGAHKAHLPPLFGLNIAVSPGVSDETQEKREVLEATAAFLEADVRPAWFTLNLSCPNTEDDPAGRQSEALARHLCAAVVPQVAPTPLWVKISPNLSAAQLHGLLRACAETGVRALIATNTLAQPTPDDDSVQGGMSGERLFGAALATVRALAAERERQAYTIDIIACGGVLDGAAYHAYRQLGVQAVQYWSALVYRGPLAAALIAQEASEIA